MGSTTTMKLNAGYRHYNTTPFGISAMGGYLKKIIKYVKILNSILVNQIYKIILVSLFGLSEKWKVKSKKLNEYIYNTIN